MAHLHFEEEQRFTNVIWIWIVGGFILLLPVGMTLADEDTTRENLTAILLSMAMSLLIVVGILIYSKLQVKINEEGLHYKFFPAITKWKMILKNEIESFEVTPAQNLIEKVEMGHKRNIFNKTITMNITGKKFARIQLKDGRKFKIGTDNAEGFERALRRLLTPDNN
jgi:hypothetical protein